MSPCGVSWKAGQTPSADDLLGPLPAAARAELRRARVTALFDLQRGRQVGQTKLSISGNLLPCGRALVVVGGGSVAVHQQGLHNGRRLVRQRTRWFQGHLQAWNLIPRILRSDLKIRTKFDICGLLVLPALLLLV